MVGLSSMSATMELETLLVSMQCWWVCDHLKTAPSKNQNAFSGYCKKTTHLCFNWTLNKFTTKMEKCIKTFVFVFVITMKVDVFEEIMIVRQLYEGERVAVVYKKWWEGESLGEASYFAFLFSSLSDSLPIRLLYSCLIK